MRQLKITKSITNRETASLDKYLQDISKEELIGSPHSINRHPDMPKGVFRAMWKIISAKKVWRGYVKNLRKDGKFYWTLVYIQANIHAGEMEGKEAALMLARDLCLNSHQAYLDAARLNCRYFSLHTRIWHCPRRIRGWRPVFSAAAERH